MKTSSYILAIALSALFWIGTGCGQDHSHDHEGETTEHSHDDHAGHDHDHDDHAGHDHDEHDDHEHETSTNSNANSKTAHGYGQEYTAMYVCPMHCAGSGGNEPGKCATCGMEYVRFRNHVSDGHHHRND